MTRLRDFIGTTMEDGIMTPEQLEKLADSLAAVQAEIDAGDLTASKAGRAYLEGAEAALRAVTAKG